MRTSLAHEKQHYAAAGTVGYGCHDPIDYETLHTEHHSDIHTHHSETPSSRMNLYVSLLEHLPGTAFTLPQNGAEMFLSFRHVYRLPATKSQHHHHNRTQLRQGGKKEEKEKALQTFNDSFATSYGLARATGKFKENHRTLFTGASRQNNQATNVTSSRMMLL